MKLIRKFLTASLLLFASGLFAQTTSDIAVVEGQRGTMKIFDALGGFNEVYLSRNEQFFYGKFESTNGFIYDIKNEALEVFDYGIIAVNDLDNYVANTFAVIEGQRYDFDMQGLAAQLGGGNFAIEEASADLRTLRAFCYIGAYYRNVFIETTTGRISDTLPHPWPDYTEGGTGAMGLGMSNDAMVVAGRASAPFAYTNFSPVFWDRQIDTFYYVGGSDRGINTDGSLHATNNDGSLICGDVGDIAWVYRYDRASRSFSGTRIDPSAGNEISYAYAISEKGQVLGVDQMSGPDVYSRQAFLYNMDKGEKYMLVEYLSNVYGLEAESVIPLFTPGGISDDGRIIAGYSYRGSVWVPYLIELDSVQVHGVVRNFVANQSYGTAHVNLSWDAPIEDQYTVAGYNVYRDTVKVNTDLLASTEFSYIDYSATPGRHEYAVEAVYTDGETSGLCAPQSLLVVAVGGCLPVQEISSEVVYNRTVNLSWGLPTGRLDKGEKSAAALMEGTRPESSIFLLGEAAASERPEASAPKGYVPDQLDLIDVFATDGIYASSAFRAGNYYYVAQFASADILVYNAITGNLAEEVTVQGISDIYDMAYHDNTIYMVNRDQTVRELSINPDDPFDISLSNFWNTSVPALVHIAYVENPDGDDYLAMGYYDNIFYYPIGLGADSDRLPGSEKLDIDGLIISGSEYHAGRLYLADQNGANLADVVILDMESGERVSTTDLYAFPAVSEAALDGPVVIASLCKSVLPDQTVALECMLQPTYAFNQVVSVEIESNPATVGYNVYRNGVKVNNEPIKARHFSEEILESGTYTYDIEYVSSTCTSRSSDVDVTEVVDIFPIGECYGPADLAVRETNEQAVVSWDFSEEDPGIGLVGFNVYRDGELLADLLIDLKYVDADIEKDRDYVYKVEAFYENSCMASDSVEVTFTFEGSAQAPSLVRVEGEKEADGTYTTQTTWDLPYFEEPMALGYCNIPYSAVSLDNFTTTYAMIGWDTASMDNFEDLYLVGMEYIIGAEVLSLNGVVYVDDRMVYNEPNTSRIRVGDWNQLFFSQTFPMKQEMEIAVGYAISFDPNSVASAGNIVFDYGPGKAGYSDLISPDANTWYTLAGNSIDANLCINALVVRKRDLDEAVASPDPKAYIRSKARVLSPAELPMRKAAPELKAGKSTSESFTLQGFNVYRDGEKINDALLTGFSFEQNGVPAGEYEYSVGAVYAQAEEMISEPVYIDLTGVGVEGFETASGIWVYPNPVSDVLNIEGEYRSLSVMDLGGKLVLQDVRNARTVSLEGLGNGAYFLRFVLPDGQARIIKIVKR